MLQERDVKISIIKSFKNRNIFFWFVIRLLSSISPLIITYIFSQGIAAIEASKPVKVALSFFIFLMCLEIVEHLFRVYSKARLAYYTESSIIQLQKDLVVTIGPTGKDRKEVVQTLRNLTQALRRFLEYMYTNGVQGVVSFAAIPIILFFIDRRIFVIELILIIIYLIFTYVLSKKYEKKFERFDSSREKYFAKLLASNNITEQATTVLSDFKKVRALWFVDWFTSQSLVTLFVFIITYFVVTDIFAGTKQISDLVLILGYAKESKSFLNEITSALNSLMEVEAGIERVSKISGRVGLIIHKNTT